MWMPLEAAEQDWWEDDHLNRVSDGTDQTAYLQTCHARNLLLSRIDSRQQSQ